MRVLLDTHVVIAGLAYPGGAPGRIVNAWRSGALSVVLSPWILAAIERVLPKLRRFTAMTAEECRDLADSLALMADCVEPDERALQQALAAPLRDPADIPVLATLPASGAQALVTDDQDLLALPGRFAIVSPAEFCARHAPQRPQPCGSSHRHRPAAHRPRPLKPRTG